jgi:hypothetical protein
MYVRRPRQQREQIEILIQHGGLHCDRSARWFDGLRGGNRHNCKQQRGAR